jgi:hypothetical protein
MKQQYSEPTIMNQTLLPASQRLKTVNLTKSSTKSHTNSYQKQPSYALDSVGASTEDVCWLPGVNTVSTTGEQVLKLCKQVVILAQQENKGRYNNNYQKL